MSALTITHTYDEGTLVDGTARGDASRDVLREHRLRWSRNLGQWYIPRSRDRAANRRSIEALAEALRGAGFTVTVEIDDTPNAVDERERRRVDASRRRADRLEQRADRKDRESNEQHERSHAAVAGIPMGQPILVGHHSQRRHERALETSHAAMGRAVQASKEAERARQGAQASRQEVERRDDPVFIGRRIAQYQTEVRKYARRTDRPDLVQDAQANLDYWLARRDELGIREWTRDDFQVGDLVQIRRDWEPVVKVNRKTVSVQPSSVPWTMKYEFHEVTARRRDGEVVEVVPVEEVAA